MNKFEFDSTLAKVQACLGELEPPVVEDLRARFIRIQQETWAKVCDRVVREVKFRPRVAHFFAAYSVEREEVARTGEVERGPTCEGCSGQRWVDIRLGRGLTGEERDVMRPCPRCGPPWSLPAGWIEIPLPGTWLEREARKLTPKRAEFALAELERCRSLVPNMPQAAILALVERAGASV